MTDRSASARRAREALALRAAVLRHLSFPRDARAAEGLLAATPSTWSLLLRLECCALPLVARLRADGALTRFTAEVQQCLASAEAAELQRVLAARLLIRELDAIGARTGVRFALLKGGAIAADAARQPLDLGDVDVMATRESAERAWQALLDSGWSPAEWGLVPADELGPRPHYAPLRNARHELPLELHERFDYGLPPARTEDAAEGIPIAGYRCIDRIAGPRAIAATLRHSVAVHPHRRGHLRDLFLLAELLRELDDEQLSGLERDLQGDVENDELLAMLAQARALSRGEALADPEILRPFVCYKYAVQVGTSRLLRTNSPGWNTWSHVPVERPALRRAMYRRLLRGATEPIARDWSPLRHPVIGSRVARALALPRLVRVVRRAALVLSLIALGPVIRRRVTALTFGPKGVD